MATDYFNPKEKYYDDVVGFRTPSNTGTLSRPSLGIPQNLQNLNLQNYYKNVQANNPYALDTNTQAIKNMYDQATAAAQAVEESKIQNAENAWQRNLASTQQTALDTIRKNNASAIATGASKGMQAANELSAVLGLQDTAVEESTALAQQRLDLADKYAAEYAQNAVTAQETANANKQAMLGQALSAYSADLNAATALRSAMYDAQTQAYAAELSNDADKYLADMSYNTELGAAKIGANAETYSALLAAEAARYGYNQQYLAQDLLAKSNVEAAKSSNETYALFSKAIELAKDNPGAANAILKAIGLDSITASDVGIVANAATITNPSDNTAHVEGEYPNGTSLNIDSGLFKSTRDTIGINKSIKDTNGVEVGKIAERVKGSFKDELMENANLGTGKIVYYKNGWYTQGTFGQIYRVNLNSAGASRFTKTK